MMRFAAPFLLSVSLFAQTPGTIQTVAGNGTTAYSGDGVAATSAALNVPVDVATDGAGNLFVVDQFNHRIRKVATDGTISTVAGNGSAGFSGDGALAVNAQINTPTGVFVDTLGNLYIADTGNARIRKVDLSGRIATIAGNGVKSYSGDGGAAVNASLFNAVRVTTDAAGNNVYIADQSNHRIRKITGGVITTIAGNGVGTPAAGSFSGDGGQATNASLNNPTALAIDSSGVIYFSDQFNHRIRRIAADGTISTIAGSGTPSFSGDGGAASAATLNYPGGITIDPAGNIYFSDDVNYRVRKISSGTITTIAGNGAQSFSGDGGPATSAALNGNFGIALDPQGNIYIADSANNRIRKIVSTPLPVPAIRTTTPVLTSFLGNAGFSSNTYLEIYGTNLSTSTRLWAGADFNGSNAPTSLDGVTVTINNKPAFVYYVSPTQINVNTPEDTATGPVSIQVKSHGTLSNSITATRSRLSPSLQTTPAFNVGGKQYVVALTPDFKTFIGRVGLISGVAFAPAKPGDTISIYALGCGPTNPATSAGIVAAQASTLASPYQVKIGGVVANTSFAGLVGGTIGLYQFNVTIPAVATGDQSVELIVDSVPNGQNLVITIGQ